MQDARRLRCRRERAARIPASVVAPGSLDWSSHVPMAERPILTNATPQGWLQYCRTPQRRSDTAASAEQTHYSNACWKIRPRFERGLRDWDRSSYRGIPLPPREPNSRRTPRCRLTLNGWQATLYTVRLMSPRGGQQQTSCVHSAGTPALFPCADRIPTFGSIRLLLLLAICKMNP